MSPQKGVSGKPSSASPGGSSPGGSSPGGSSPGGSSGSSRLDSIRLAVSFADVVASISKLGSLLQVELIDLERGLGRGGIRGNPSVKRLQGIAQGLAFVGLGGRPGSSASPGGSSPGGSSPGGSSPGGSSPGGSSPGGSSRRGLAALSELSTGLLDAGRAIERGVAALRPELTKRGRTTSGLDRIEQLAIAFTIIDPARVGRLGQGVGQSPGGSSPGGSSPGGSSPGGSSPGGSSPGGSSPGGSSRFGLDRLYGATARLSEVVRGLGGFGQSPGGSSPGGSSPGGSSPGGSSPGGSSPGGSSLVGLTDRFRGQSPVVALFESMVGLASAVHGVRGLGGPGGLRVTSPREAFRGKAMAPKSPPRGRG
jgi:hypothetical protein